MDAMSAWLRIRDQNLLSATYSFAPSIVQQDEKLHCSSPTYHENHRGRTREQVFSANGAVALKAAFDTLVIVFEVDDHADIALFAMEEILVETVSDPTDPAVGTVVHGLCRVIIPEFANVAIITRQLFVAGVTGLSSWLNGFAVHTEHRLCFVPKWEKKKLMD